MNLRVNCITAGRARFIAASVEDGLVRVAREVWDAVILDPPRQGCPAPVLTSVFRRIAPPRAVYVSCNPDTLAAEVPLILNAGYGIERIEASICSRTPITLRRSCASSDVRHGPSLEEAGAFVESSPFLVDDGQSDQCSIPNSQFSSEG